MSWCEQQESVRRGTKLDTDELLWQRNTAGELRGKKSAPDPRALKTGCSLTRKETKKTVSTSCANIHACTVNSRDTAQCLPPVFNHSQLQQAECSLCPFTPLANSHHTLRANSALYVANASKLSLVIILINNTQNVSEQETTAAYLIKGVIMDG